MTVAAFVPTPPLLVPEVAGGSAHRDADLREACRQAVAALTDGDRVDRVDRVVVVGAAPRTAVYTGRFDPRPFGVPGPEVQALPYALGVGEWLLRGLHVAVTFHGVGVGETPLDGAALAAGGRVGLLVCGDGTARRDEKAPGHLDPRAEPFDADVVAALRSGEPDRLRALDPDLGDALLATGVRPWHVLADAAGHPRRGQVSYAAAPYGVAYTVGTWT